MPPGQLKSRFVVVTRNSPIPGPVVTILDAADNVGRLYIPSPVQWAWVPDVVQIHPQNLMTSLDSVTDVATGNSLAGSYWVDDATRPLLRFDPSLRGRKVVCVMSGGNLDQAKLKWVLGC